MHTLYIRSTRVVETIFSVQKIASGMWDARKMESYTSEPDNEVYAQARTRKELLARIDLKYEAENK